MKETAVTMVYVKTIDVNVIQDMTIKTTQIVQVSCIKRSTPISSKCSIVHLHVIQGWIVFNSKGFIDSSGSKSKQNHMVNKYALFR